MWLFKKRREKKPKGKKLKTVKRGKVKNKKEA